MHSAYWNVFGWVLLSVSVILLVRGVWELFKRTPLGKLIGIAWIAFAVCFGCVAFGLDSINKTWHLRNSQKPWSYQLVLDGMMLMSGVVGMTALAKVKTLLKATEDRFPKIETAEDNSVWPPAPRKP